jgi:hypothetical protein
MPKRELEEWGGEVHVPRWVRKVLHRPAPPGDTAEKQSEWTPPPPPERSVAENANRANTGVLTDLYREGREGRRKRR